jgi:hypothetical protein
MSLIRTSVCLAVAILCSQFPAFEAYYETRLQARVAEVHKQVQLFKDAASASSLTLEDYIKLFEAQPLKPFQEGAKVMRKTLSRSQLLEQAWKKLISVHYPYKALVWIHQLDFELVSDTWSHYQWALVLNKESGIFAAAGLFIGYILHSSSKILIQKTLRSVTSRFRSKSRNLEGQLKQN